jgi:hypothetical protein
MRRQLSDERLRFCVEAILAGLRRQPESCTCSLTNVENVRRIRLHNTQCVIQIRLINQEQHIRSSWSECEWTHSEKLAGALTGAYEMNSWVALSQTSDVQPDFICGARHHVDVESWGNQNPRYALSIHLPTLKPSRDTMYPTNNGRRGARRSSVRMRKGRASERYNDQLPYS